MKKNTLDSNHLNSTGELEDSKPEKEDEILNPEIIESIMEKKRDIFEYGTPYTSVLRIDSLGDVLRDGILGRPRTFEPIGGVETDWMTKSGEINPTNWKNNLKRKEKDVAVSFNIQGRSFPWRDLHYIFKDESKKYMKEDVEFKTKRMKAEKRLSQWFEFGGVAIVFDISDMKEVEPSEQEYLSDLKKFIFEPIPRGAYAIRGPKEQISKKPDEKGNVITADEFGFSFPNRIPPRRYRGIVVIPKRLEEVVQTMLKVYKDKPWLLVPVYDDEGNMLWPKKVPYAELKISQRD